MTDWTLIETVAEKLGDTPETEAQVEICRALLELRAVAPGFRTPLASVTRRAQDAHQRFTPPPSTQWTVVFQNPATGEVRPEFASLADAEARVEHYESKYGEFPGYERATVIPPARF